MSKSACPICDKPAAPTAENKSYPFCSNRCKMLDLSRWFSGDYVLSRPIDPDQDADAIERYVRENEERH